MNLRLIKILTKMFDRLVESSGWYFQIVKIDLNCICFHNNLIFMQYFVYWFVVGGLIGFILGYDAKELSMILKGAPIILLILYYYKQELVFLLIWFLVGSIIGHKIGNWRRPSSFVLE